MGNGLRLHRDTGRRAVALSGAYPLRTIPRPRGRRRAAACDRAPARPPGPIRTSARLDATERLRHRSVASRHGCPETLAGGTGARPERSGATNGVAVSVVPFTFSHPAAVLPLARRGLVFSALVVGSMAPDFPYFVQMSAKNQ